jgi:hypothetical protein
MLPGFQNQADPTGGYGCWSTLGGMIRIDNLGYKPMLVIAAIKPQFQSLEAPVLTGRRLTFNPHR